jgi:hypothetical protein
MKNLILVIISFGFLTGIIAQNTISVQPILNLSVDELNNVGITIKNNKIIVKNDNPNGLKFHLIIYKNSYRPEVGDSIASTNYDFYPYYISTMDSVSGFLSYNDEKENGLKMDPLFQRKMKMNYLIPVRVKIPPDQDYLFWFQPTESFCELIPQKYTIVRKYVPDSLINSDVALRLDDQELKNIGFVIDDEEMYIKTYVYDKYNESKTKYICEWFNDKNNFGTSLISGNLEKFLKKDKKNRRYNIKKSDYYIVRVTDVNGDINYDMGDYTGLVIPIYIDNKGFSRPYKNKQDVVIYLSYSPSLVKKMIVQSFEGWWSNPARYTIDYKKIKKN